MPTTETHYALNTKQLAILRLLYRFRFATSNHLAFALDIKHISKINQRLQILLDQKYIGRNYDGQYKIHGKPAEYYLLQDGIKALKQQMRDKCDDKVLHNLYKDKNASQQFVAESLGVFTIFCQLKKRYGDSLRLFSANQIAAYKHFPRPLPDALIRLDVNNKQKEFFLEVVYAAKPFFPYVGMVRRYIKYSDEGKWQEATDTKLPKILVVCETVGLQIRFQRQAARFLSRHYDEEPKVFTTNMAKLQDMAGVGRDTIWRDAEESETAIALSSI
ncbi:MAG: replication-relaxation family protein [Candidatus Saccharimonadales bacterium]